MKKSVLLILALIIVFGCKRKNTEEPSISPNQNISSSINDTYGYSLLDKIKGIWNGPVTSTTPLGGYPEWIVDFRPISENQISAKNELDTLNDILMSFFIVKYNNQYKLAFRNGGSFDGRKRIAYFICDSVSESSNKSFYRFSEIIQGKTRAYTEVEFVQDSLYIKSYTNKYSTLTSATPHMVWSAHRKDLSSCQGAVSLFNFPKKTLTKDFSSVFSGQSEAIYYALNGLPQGDPYSELEHPYLGNTKVNYTFNANYTPVASTKVFLIITTQPLINGATINMNNLNTRSRYVVLSANDNEYTFNYMHPGNYYLYALYDKDNNNVLSSGDWISSSNTSFSLASESFVNISTVINFTIP